MNYYLIKPKNSKVIVNERELEQAIWKSIIQYEEGTKVIVPIGYGAFIGTITKIVDKPELPYVRDIIYTLDNFPLPLLYKEVKYSNAIEGIEISKEQMVEHYLKKRNKL